MKLSPFVVVLFALLCLGNSAYGEPEADPEPIKHVDIDGAATTAKINPRFYMKVNRNDPRSMASSDNEDDYVTGEDEGDVTEEEEDENDIEGDDDSIQTYYPVSDDSGQTYLIPESVIQDMADKQQDNDDSDTYLVPNGSVHLDEEDTEEGDNNSAIILSDGSMEENSLEDGNQFIAIVQDPEMYGKARRVMRRGGNVRRRRRGGGVRRRRRRGGSQMGLKRRRTVKRIRRGGGGRRGGRRGGGGGRRRVRLGGRGGGGGGGGVRLGRIRVRPRRGGYRG